MPETTPARLLQRNAEFVRTGAEARRDVPRLAFQPRQGVLVITCLDPRTDPAAFLGIGLGDAIVLRTVGGRVTPCVIRDVAFTSYLVETKTPDGPHFEVAVIHHTDCGSGLLAGDELRQGFSARTGYDEADLAALAVDDPAETVRADVELLLADGRLSPRVEVSGYVYDVITGVLSTVVEPASPNPHPTRPVSA